MMPEIVALILVVLYAFAGLAVLFLGGRLIRYDLARSYTETSNSPPKPSRLVEDLRPVKNLVVEFFAHSRYFSRLLNILARKQKPRRTRRNGGVSVTQIAWPAAVIMAVTGLVRFHRRGLVLTDIGREVQQRIRRSSTSNSANGESLNGRQREQVLRVPSLEASKMSKAIEATQRTDEVPSDVITINSRTQLLDLDTNERMEFTLVLPRDADIESGKISVRAPLGAVMLGHRVGDEFVWTIPYGRRRLKVLAVHFQPEAVLALAA